MSDDLTTRLRRYGDTFAAAVDALDGTPPPPASRRPDSPRRLLVVAVAVLLVGVMAAVLVTRGSGPERVRTVVSPSTTPASPRSVACPGSLVVSARTSPDALPAASSRTTDRAHVAVVVGAAAPTLRAQYRGVTSITLGPGGGYQWVAGSGGTAHVVHVADYAIHVALANQADCPKPPRLYSAYDGVDVLFFAPPGPSGPVSTTSATSTPAPGPGAGAVVAQLALPHLTMGAGSSMWVVVTVDNRSGHVLHPVGCTSLFQVVLSSPKVRPDLFWTACAQRFTIPVGPSTYRVWLGASYPGCSLNGAAGVACVDGKVPALAPGLYQARLYQNPHVAEAPLPVTVRVTP